MRVGKIPVSDPANVATPEDSSFVLMFISSVDSQVYFKRNTGQTFPANGLISGNSPLVGGQVTIVNPLFNSNCFVQLTVKVKAFAGGSQVLTYDLSVPGELTITSSVGVGDVSTITWSLIVWPGM